MCVARVQRFVEYDAEDRGLKRSSSTRIIFRTPSGEEILNPSVAPLRPLFLNTSEEFWLRESGDATIYRIEDGKKSELIIMPNHQYGVYLNLSQGSELWLSLHDESLLGEVTEAAEHINASVGLFLPWADAWIAVEEFCRNGRRSEQIRWIQPLEVPPEGNY